MIQSGAPVTTVPLIRVTHDSPCLCSAPPRIIKRAWPSPKWSWPPPTSETRTAGASTSTRPSRTSGRPSTCGVHQRLGSGQTAYSNTARYNRLDEGGVRVLCWNIDSAQELNKCPRQQKTRFAEYIFSWSHTLRLKGVPSPRSLRVGSPCVPISLITSREKTAG